MNHDLYENDYCDNETEDYERIKRQCISYDNDMIKDYINPLHCIPYTIVNSDGTNQVRYSLSEAYFTHLCEMSKPFASSSLSEGEEEIEELFDSDVISHKSLPFVPPNPFPPPLIFPKIPMKRTRIREPTNSIFYMKAKTFSRLHALKYYFAGTIPNTQPSYMTIEEWDILQLSNKAGTLLMFEKFAEGSLSVRTYPTYDNIIHSAVIYGASYLETSCTDHTRYRWWSDAEVIGFNPIQNLRKVGNKGGLKIAFPQAITAHPYLLELFRTLRHRELGRIISELIDLYIEKLIGRVVYNDYTVCGFKHHGKPVRIRHRESPEIFGDILLKYFLDNPSK